MNHVPATTTDARARSTTECVHRPECPGCPMFGQPVAEQLAAKRARLVAALARYPELAALDPGSVRPAEPSLGYRRRAKLAVGTRGEIGLYARGGHDVVDLPDCRINAPRLHAVIGELRRALADAPLPIAAIDVRDTSSGVLVTLISSADAEELRPWAETLAQRIPSLCSVAASRREEGSAQLLGRDLGVLWGTDSVRDQTSDAEPWILASHGSFVQAHAEQAAAIRSAITRAVVDGRRRSVLELHAGSGELALALAGSRVAVTAIEQFAPAAERMRRAAAEQHLALDVLVGDVVDRVLPLVASGRRFDVIVVNPPRRGLPPTLRAALAELAPAELFYVSCEPETLARDLADLARLGLRADAVSGYDMIPQSAEVETLARVRAAEVPAPTVIWEDERLIAVVKLPHEPTTPQGGRPDALLHRVRRLHGAEAAVPVHRLDAGTSGVCLFARKPEFVDAIARALALGEKRYTALVRGIARDKGVVNRPLRERGARIHARTRYRRVAVAGGHSLLDVRPDQGRKHQIRRHLAEVGHPVLGDGRYGHEPSNRHVEHKHGLERTFLHCASINLELDGVERRFEAPLAGDLQSVLASLEPAE